MSGGAVQAKPPEIPPPPDSSIVSIGEDMRINGNPTVAYSFKSESSRDQVLQFYRREWKRGTGDLPGFVETEEAPWNIITRIEDRYLMTVQVKPEGDRNSSGFLSVSELPARGEKRDTERFPQMRGSRVLSDVETSDPGKKGRTMVILNGKSVASNVNYYRNYFEGHGWAAQRDRDFAGEAHVLVFSRGDGLVNIVIAQNDRDATSIVVNAVNF